MRMIGFVLGCCALAWDASAATDRQARTFPWAAGRLLVLEITNGTIRVEGASRPDVDVAIQRTAPSADGLDLLPVTIDEAPDRVTVRIATSSGPVDQM